MVSLNLSRLSLLLREIPTLTLVWISVKKNLMGICIEILSSCTGVISYRLSPLSTQRATQPSTRPTTPQGTPPSHQRFHPLNHIGIFAQTLVMEIW